MREDIAAGEVNAAALHKGSTKPPVSMCSFHKQSLAALQPFEGSTEIKPDPGG